MGTGATEGQLQHVLLSLRNDAKPYCMLARRLSSSPTGVERGAILLTDSNAEKANAMGKGWLAHEEWDRQQKL